MNPDLNRSSQEAGVAKRVLVIGGVAGGASAAARLRRLDERCEIVIFDRGPYVSFANCGLPYYVGNVIQKEKKLLVASAELFRDRFQIDVRTDHEVLAIDRKQHMLTVKALKTGVVTEERWDAIVLSPGANAIKPPIPGIGLPGIFSVRTIPDSRNVREWITTKQAKTALVVGGGFIGLEMAENLAQRGLAVTIVEKAAQLLPPLDAEMAAPLKDRLVAHGVTVRLSEGVTGFALADDGKLMATIDRGLPVTADLVILSIGVRPETTLAKQTGLTLGVTGGIWVDESMRTSDPAIWAVGDAVETTDVVTGLRQLVPLAGPANRQGRVAAEAIAGRGTHFRGVQGTAVCGAFGLTIALTGASERTLKRAGISDYDKVYLHPGHHVGYYPGAKPIHLKVLYRKSDGRLLGAQALGEEGVEKRIDVLSMAIQLGGTVHDLGEAELAYAPQFGAAKDPVNFVGFIAENARNGDMPMARWEDVGKGFVLDVREPSEVANGAVLGAVNIPLHQLRTRLDELPKDTTLRVCCAVGQRAYYAVRLLRQNGFDAQQLPGGYQTFQTL